MKSMTGYGKAVVYQDGMEITVELKSVNHRFLDISSKMPRTFLSYDAMVRDIISKNVSRGHIDVFVNYKKNADADKAVSVDVGMAKEYVAAVGALKENFPMLVDDFTVTSLLRSPEVLNIEQVEENEEAIRKLLSQALEQAAIYLNAMREKEGNKLCVDLIGKIDSLDVFLKKIKDIAPNLAENYRDKLRERINIALGDITLDESKLANEVCFYADKVCIDEEITRLSTHLEHARDILRSNESVGRKMDFLIQEINRETNTICSKSGSLELTEIALEMKNEIEKIREQAQNLE